MNIEDLFLSKTFAKTTISFIVIFKSFEIQTNTNYIPTTKGLTLHSYVNTYACQFRKKVDNLYKIYKCANKSFNFNWQFRQMAVDGIIIVMTPYYPTY